MTLPTPSTAKPLLILFINPNSSQSMTDGVAQTLTTISPDIELHYYTAPTPSPSSINNEEDARLSTSAVLDGLGFGPTKSAPQGLSHPINHYAGIIVGCYSPHPLVSALRSALRAHPAYPSTPVIVGIFESSFYAALQLGSKFGIVTTGVQWEDIMMKGMLSGGGVDPARCVGVRGTGIGVLELDGGGDDGNRDGVSCSDYADNVERVYRILMEKSLDLIEKGAEVILLGCAGMTLWQSRLQRGVNDALQIRKDRGGKNRLDYVPVVDGVRAAIEQAAAMARMR
ncbi:hypothetical protein HDV00_001987 [Rhizophlyctis rosea]|nr:hypothetical protein HDV00_001987 [Rhizophlyctis rosea]